MPLPRAYKSVFYCQAVTECCKKKKKTPNFISVFLYLMIKNAFFILL